MNNNKFIELLESIISIDVKEKDGSLRRVYEKGKGVINDKVTS